MLWDRGEGAGYVQHVTADPYAGTPAKTVLLHVAFGDWQVSELTALIEARTMGVTIHRPVTADGRSREVDPGWGLETDRVPERRLGASSSGTRAATRSRSRTCRRRRATTRTRTREPTPTCAAQKARSCSTTR